MKLGFTSTSFKQIKDLNRIADIAVESGAEIIEWVSSVHVKDMETARKVKEICEGKGIEIPSYATYYHVGSKDTESWKQICEIASAMNCSSIRVWLGSKPSKKTSAEDYLEILEDTRMICAVADRYGLIVCAECHDNTFNDNTDAFLKLVKEAGCSNMKTYFQSRYKKLEYDLDRIERTLPYIHTIHLSYSEQVREQFPFHIRKDYINIIIDKILSTGFDGNMYIEYTYIMGFYGIPKEMKKHMQRLRERVGSQR